MPQIERDLARLALENLVQAASPQAFRESLPALREKYDDDVEWVGRAYGAFLGEFLLAPAGLFAALYLPPAEARERLAEIESAVSAITYPRLPRSLDKEARAFYQSFAHFAQAAFPTFAAAMRAVLTHYVALEDDPAADPDALIETALAEAEEDLPRARERIALAAALVLAGKAHWPRWRQEKRGPAGDWLGNTLHVCDVLGRAGLYGPLAEARREWDAAAERFQSPEKAAPEEAEEEEEEEETDPLEEEIFAHLLHLQGQPVPAELLTLCDDHRNQAVPFLLDVVADDDLWPDNAPGGGWAPIHAVELLGQLQAEEAIPLLIDLVADYEWEDMIHDRALVALNALGPAVKPELLRFLRYSRDNVARAELSWALAENCPDDKELYQAFLTLLPQVSWDEGRGLLYEALAEIGDDQAIPLLQEALQDPDLPPEEGPDIAALLGELGGEIPAGYEDWEQDAYFDAAAPQTLSELVTSLSPEVLEDPAETAHMITQVFALSAYPMVLKLALSPATEGEPPPLAAFVQGLHGMLGEAAGAPVLEEQQAVLDHLRECSGPQMLQVFAGLEAILDAYVAGGHDLAADVNEQIAQARALLAQDEEAARRLVGQAGAAALRGADFWRRWPEETPEPLTDWLWGLRSFLHYLRSAQRYPLADVATERARPVEFFDMEPATAPAPPAEVRELLRQIADLPAETFQPSPEALAGFERWRTEAIPELVGLLRETVADEDEELWWIAIQAAQLLGYLQAEEAAPFLVDVIADTAWEDPLQAAAQRALVAIGRPAGPAVTAYFRYGQDLAAKIALAEALARTADKDPATLGLLAQLWAAVDWPQQRRLVAVALADLGDRHAIALLQEALDNPRSDFADQVHLRWALQRLGRDVDLYPSSRLFYGLLDGRARIRTPLLSPPVLDLDGEKGTARRARYTIWGEPICHHCGQPLVWASEQEGWKHPEETKPAPQKGPAAQGSKRSRRKKRGSK